MIRQQLPADAAPRTIWIHSLGAKTGGGITYLHSVLPELFRQLEGTNTRLILMLPAPLTGFSIPDWCEVRLYPVVANVPLLRLLFDQVVLPLLLARQPNATLFCSGSFPPLLKTVPTVVLIRNAIYFEADFLRREQPARRLLLKLQGGLIRLSARTCHALHYPSGYMRRLVERGVPALVRRGVLNYYGISDVKVAARYAPSPPNPAPGWLTFLYVINYTRQKNLTVVLRALALARAAGLKVRVVVTSNLRSSGRSFQREDRDIIDRHQLIKSGYLVPVGSTFDDDLVKLYLQLDACLFASICESFGHPLVEALAIGKPIACADRPYAHEICGEHAFYFDPDRPEDLVALWQRWPQEVAGWSPPPLADLTGTFSWPHHVSRLVQDLVET